MKLNTCIFVVCSFLIAGCSSTWQQIDSNYKDSDVSIVHDDGEMAGAIIWFVDGKNRGNGNFDKFVLVPGDHTLGVRYFYHNGLVQTYAKTLPEIEFKAIAGEQYRLGVEVSEETNSWKPIIASMSTGKIVSRLTGKYYTTPNNGVLVDSKDPGVIEKTVNTPLSVLPYLLIQ